MGTESTGDPLTSPGPQARPSGEWRLLASKAHALAREIVHDQQFAQDLAQSVLARLILCRDHVQNVGAWLRVALRHLASAERKRRASHGSEVPAEEWNLPAVEPDCVLHLQVGEVLRALPPREAEILALAARGASHREIAEQIGCRAGDVGSLLARAQAKARRQRAR